MVKVGDLVKVKVLGIDDRGKVKLSMQAVDQETGEDDSAQERPKADAAERGRRAGAAAPGPWPDESLRVALRKVIGHRGRRGAHAPENTLDGYPRGGAAAARAGSNSTPS